MSNRIKIIILISAGLIIVIALLFILNVVYKQHFSIKKNPIESPVTELKTEEQTFLPSEIVPQTETEKAKNKLERITLNFIESIGSYSNQSDFQNIIGLKNIATPKMQIWIDDFIKQKNKPSDVYSGISTKVLAIKKNNFDLGNNQAELLINTQRQEAKESTQNTKVFYQDVSIKLIKESDDWKIDEIEWKKY
ncbi:MAG: hypothetical protein AAB526_01390 [Patescibacteria group bacterium]